MTFPNPGSRAQPRPLPRFLANAPVDHDFMCYDVASGKWKNVTVSVVTSRLPVFSSSAKGLAPASGASTSVDFLCADGTWSVPAGSGITALTGDVTASGSGSQAATIATHAVTNGKLAQMNAHTFKGNNTGSTADAADLTATQLTAELNAVVGDTGSGGTKGLVPAPGAGDAAAGKFLKADGTFAVPASGASTYAALTDVTLTSLSDKQYMRYDNASGKWKNYSDGYFTSGVINANAAALPAGPTGTKWQIGGADSADVYSVLDAFLATPYYVTRLSRGTAASPTAIQSGDIMGGFAGEGYGSTGYSGKRAAIAFAASQTWTDTVQGGKVDVYVTPNGGTSLAKKYTFDNDGGFYAAGATGGSKGDGTGNFTGIYKNGSEISTLGGGGGLGGLYSGSMSLLPTQSGVGMTSWYNQLASSTVTDQPCGITVYGPSQGGSNKISAIMKNSAGSGTAKKYTALITRTALTDSNAGIIFGWSDGTKAHVFSVNGNGTPSVLTVTKWTNSTTYSAAESLTAVESKMITPVWLQCYDDATNIVFKIGFDGVNFVTVFTIARSSGHLGSTGYTKIIFGINGYDAECYASMLSYSEV